jgi:hypothetical protein
MADATVDVPGIGGVKKEWLYAGGALIVGVVGYAYFKRRASGGTVTADVGSGEGDAFQGAALPQGAYDAYGNLAANNATSNPPANWTERAIDYLSTAMGYDKQTVGMAITHYLAGDTLTPAEGDLIGLARALIGPDPLNTPLKIGPAPPATTTTTTTTPTTTPVADSWDTWQASQVSNGLYRSDPNGGLDWGVVARNTFGAAANPTRGEVYQRALTLQSKNPDAARRYMTYVPSDVARGLVY